MPPHPALAPAAAALAAGALDEADRLCREAVRASPDDPKAWRLLARVQRARGRTADAADCWERAARLAPDPDADLELGRAYLELGRAEPAAAALRRALAARPAWFEALTQLGIALGSAGRSSEAVAAFEAAVRARPEAAQAHHNLGVARIQSGDPAAGTAALRRALDLQPNYAEAHYNLGTALAALGRRPEAIDHYRRAVGARPAYPEALNNLGLALTDAGRADEAVAFLRHAVRLRPDFPEGHGNLGIALDALGQFDEAEAAHREALRLDPASAEAHTNLGNACKSRGRLAEALACYELALWHRPDDPGTRFNRSLALLQAGDYERGWAEYEWRLRRPKGTTRCPSDRPAWDGADPAGRTVLVWAEQGLGDAVQFVRYVPLLGALKARVLVHVPGLLADLVGSVADSATVVPEGTPLPPHDLHCPLMSLPHRLGTTLATVPATVPYLMAPPVGAGRWRDRIVAGGGFTVGLYWQGNPHHVWDRHRSVRLDALEPLGRVPGVRLVSLQQGPGREQIRSAPGVPEVADLGPDYESFSDLAAAATAVDLVVCVDTAVAHVAGALGRPAWVLLSAMSDWRWLVARPDTPWYPTVRLFRQNTLGDWVTVVRAIADRLHDLVRAPAAGGRAAG